VSRWPPLGTWAMAVALGLAAAGPARAQDPDPARAEVTGLEFDGARSFTREELSAAISSQATRCREILYAPACWSGIGGLERAYLEPGALEADALRLKIYYFERGYREAVITADTALDDDGVELTFRIEEGPPVRVADVTIEGAPEALRLPDLPVRTGDPFDVVAYEATRDTLLSLLRNNGWARAQVLLSYGIPRETPYAATVEYELMPGPQARIGGIEVEGVEETTPELVRRMLTFDEGDLYDRSALLQSQRNLYGLQIFRHANVEAELDAEPDTLVPIRIRVAEGDMRRVRVGGGLNNIECGNIEGRWTSRNFLGEGRRFTVTGRLGNLLIDQCGFLVDDEYTSYDNLTGLLSFDFNQPWFFGPRNNIGAGLFAERRNVPEVFVRSAVGGYVSVGRNLGGNAAISLAYRPELTELKTPGDLFFCVSFVGCTFEEARVLQEPHLLSPITLSFSVDRTDALFSPSEGYVVRADFEHAGSYTLSDFAYSRVLAEVSTYLGEAGGVVLASRARGGVGWAHGGGAGSGTLGLNPQKRFFAGGPNSVRGFDQYRLGPSVLGIDAVPTLVDSATVGDEDVFWPGCAADAINDGSCDATVLAAAAPGEFYLRPVGGEVLLEGNLELRFPLPAFQGKLRGAVFLDAGQVWRTRDEVRLPDVVFSPGIGVRYYSPVGPIRVDAAFDPRGWQQLQVLTTRVVECLDEEGLSCHKQQGPARAVLTNTDDVSVLTQAVSYNPRGDVDSLGAFLRRINLQFSIGQAF
jgi:outer membrane protein insertion porin family